MALLCDDIMECIYYQLPMSQRDTISKTSKQMRILYMRDLAMTKKIQRFFRNHRVKWEQYDNEEDDDKKKYIHIRIYIIRHPEKYLYTFPDDLAKKMHRPDLQEWLSNHEIKTRRDVRTFLSLDTISDYDICYTGW